MSYVNDRVKRVIRRALIDKAIATASSRNQVRELEKVADFRNVNLLSASMQRAYLCYADFSSANMHDATLRDADLSNAILRYTNLCYADLLRATISNGDLRCANLQRADLSEAILIDANLERAVLTKANLTSANLTGATLGGAILTGATLTNVVGLPSEKDFMAQFKKYRDGWIVYKAFGLHYTPPPYWKIKTGSDIEEFNINKDRREIYGRGINWSTPDWLLENSKPSKQHYALYVSQASDIIVPYATNGKARSRYATILSKISWKELQDISKAS